MIVKEIDGKQMVCMYHGEALFVGEILEAVSMMRNGPCLIELGADQRDVLDIMVDKLKNLPKPPATH